MCYHPIEVINPSKYVSLKFRDRYVMQVPCGKCAACMTLKSNEWSYRLYHHAKDTYSAGGFVVFDTLTYADEFLPHISDYIPVSKQYDFPCFSSRDLRLFVADLRQRCKRKFKSNFSYFIASEYGTSENHLHRPHYHALFFVIGNIQPLEFSALVASTWKRGRTDGVPFKPASYVLDNCFSDMSPHSIRALKYVCKYIQKSCTFQKNIDSRLDLIMRDISIRFESQGFDEWSSSSHYWRVREAISRKVNQFHRQSTFLGASVLGELDIFEVMNSNQLSMPDNEFVVKSIPLPTYFKRKLFYELVEVDGSKSWQPTELGLKYLEIRNKFQLHDLSLRFAAIALHTGLTIDTKKLADYVLNFRGRFKSDLNPSTLAERLENLSLFNYVNRYDKEMFGKCGLTTRFLGNSIIGYSRYNPPFINIPSFINQYVYFNDDYEVALNTIFSHQQQVSNGRQRVFEVKQRVSNLVHHYFP